MVDAPRENIELAARSSKPLINRSKHVPHRRFDTMKEVPAPTAPTRPQFVPTYSPKGGKRAEYRREQSQRVKESPTLSEKFPSLKTLKVKLQFFDSRIGHGNNSEVNYTVNLTHAKSIFQFGCRNPECVHGDFDLTHELAHAIEARRRKAVGELRCQGWRGKESIDVIRCNKLLRFELILGY